MVTYLGPQNSYLTVRLVRTQWRVQSLLTERFAFPSMISPCFINCISDQLDRTKSESIHDDRTASTMPAFPTGIETSNAYDPTVVPIPSSGEVVMTSFKMIGIPCNGPRTCPADRSASKDSAVDKSICDSGTEIMALRWAPAWLCLLICARYAWTIIALVREPLRSPCWSCDAVAVSTSM